MVSLEFSAWVIYLHHWHLIGKWKYGMENHIVVISHSIHSIHSIDESSSMHSPNDGMVDHGISITQFDDE